MADSIRQALDEAGLMGDYLRRPAFQHNDDLGWIKRGKREETRKKRLRKMLDELATGGIYMKMAHPASRKQLHWTGNPLQTIGLIC